MDDQKPGWGKTCGVFFLMGCLVIGGCVLTSSAIIRNMGYSGYSQGGLLALAVAIGCTAYYRSTGKIAGPAVVSTGAGIALGYLSVQLALAVG